MSVRVTTSRVLAALLMAAAGVAAQEREPKARAVLFYSPTCPHCHVVMSNDLPPLIERYGKRLVVVAISVATPEGGALYEAMMVHYRLPDDRLGVPALLVGDTLLVGSGEIPDRFPGMIERGLADKGIPWPAVPELRSFLRQQGYFEPPPPPPVTADPAPASHAETEPAAVETQPVSLTPSPVAIDLSAAPAPDLNWRDRFRLDPTGNSFAVAVLALLVMALLATLVPGHSWRPWPGGAIIGLAALGMAVAAYLGYVEVTGTDAVCGPVGDCNTVQRSQYARLFGVPIGVLGIIGYLAIIAAHLANRPRLLWLLGLAGVLFSIYLTFLEPFVIGATCAWCLSSAVIMALLLIGGRSRLRVSSS